LWFKRDAGVQQLRRTFPNAKVTFYDSNTNLRLSEAKYLV